MTYRYISPRFDFDYDGKEYSAYNVDAVMDGNGNVSLYGKGLEFGWYGPEYAVPVKDPEEHKELVQVLREELERLDMFYWEECLC